MSIPALFTSDPYWAKVIKEIGFDKFVIEYAKHIEVELLRSINNLKATSSGSQFEHFYENDRIREASTPLPYIYEANNKYGTLPNPKKEAIRKEIKALADKGKTCLNRPEDWRWGPLGQPEQPGFTIVDMDLYNRNTTELPSMFAGQCEILTKDVKPVNT